ncbi:PREDICTED: ryanodine receptor 1-like [Nipponia nippon]|uniref:ryanodine receptor 1-like n=1 Tax=Nipponia nippon TaxID=128390 RepID=UPI000511B2F2|nr:PREDICTED: ryanodine receptor 1-like [Nipponia nippon]
MAEADGEDDVQFLRTVTMAEADGEDDVQFLRTEDEVVLQCTSTLLKEQLKLCLAAEGFGSRLCSLEPTSNAQSSQGGGHRTLLYGHAILLRHSHSGMGGEACWWTMHPASKQRSEGEKVRVGDDLILVSVSSERYLHLSTASGELQADASFMQTLWNMNPICSGSEEGGRCGGTPGSVVNYEGGGVCTHARSLWRLEPLRISWSGSHLKWGQPFRLRHVTTGRYLALTEDKGLAVVEVPPATPRASAFCFRASKEKLEVVAKRDVEGMGTPEIKYGESLCFVQHVASGLWLTYAAADTKAMRLGVLKRKVRGSGAGVFGASLIRGNRANCALFSTNLDWLVSKLDRLEASSGILEVLYCVLIESPEVLNIIQENHIKSIISLLDKHGRNHKVLDVLCSLCVCNAVAVRSNQNLITENLLPRRDLLLQTGLVNYVTRWIVLPPHLERIREKLAENIHELWALTRIEQGWTYGPIRDDNQRLHPCLLSFHSLPEPERSYNLQMSGETLK